jgi:hypothetical protein
MGGPKQDWPIEGARLLPVFNLSEGMPFEATSPLHKPIVHFMIMLVFFCVAAFFIYEYSSLHLRVLKPYGHDQ